MNTTEPLTTCLLTAKYLKRLTRRFITVMNEAMQNNIHNTKQSTGEPDEARRQQLRSRKLSVEVEGGQDRCSSATDRNIISPTNSSTLSLSGNPVISPTITVVASSRSVPRRLEQDYRGTGTQNEPATTGETSQSRLTVIYGSEDNEDSSRGSDVARMPPVIVRIPNTAFGIAMGLAGNSIMWNTASEADFVGVNAGLANEILWITAVVVGAITGLAYVYRLCSTPDLCRREYADPTRIHFMNAPHLALTMLSIGIPNSIRVSETCRRVLWTIAFSAQLIITLFVYEKWMFSSTQNIAIARPQLLLSTVGWFLLSVLGQVARIEEVWGLGLPSFCFGAGTMFYILVVSNIFTRIHRCGSCKGSPSLTLLIAPPSVAVIALNGFDGDPEEFGVAAEMVLGWCLVVFLLLCKLGPMIASRPSVLGNYWAYVFPVSALGNACVQYASDVGTPAAEVMAAIFMGIATLALVVVCCRTMYHSALCFMGKEDWDDPLLKRHEDETETTSSGSP